MLLQMTCSSEGDVAPWGPNESRQNRIVFIGRNLDREGLTKSFEACLVQQQQQQQEPSKTDVQPGVDTAVTVKA